MSSRSTFNLRPLAAALLAAAAAVLALAAFASAAHAAPAVTLNHDYDLVTNPEVGVEGTGFTPPTPPPVGLYAAQIAILEDGTVVANTPNAKYIRASGPTQSEKLEADGSFSSEVEVVQTFGSGPTAADCAVDECAIATWLAHTNPTLATLYTSNPLYFAQTVDPDPTQGIAATGETISVTGGGWDPAFNGGNGFYVAQVAIVEGAVKYGPNKWVRPNANPESAAQVKLEDNGTFSMTLDLSSTFTRAGETINCGLVQCKIATWPGHSVPTTANLLTEEDISFAYSPSASVAPTTDLPETQQVTISGSGYSPASPGVYVSQVAQVGDTIVFPPPGGGSAMQWIRPGGPDPLNPDGTFETSITVSKTFQDANGATVDCSVVQCSVITWRAHTNPTTSTLYTSAPLSFSPPAKKPDEVQQQPPLDTTTPPATRPGAPVKKQRVTLGTSAAKLDVVTVRCGSADCRFQKPKRVAVKLGDRKLWLNTTGPKRAGAGKVAKFGVRVSGKVAKQLAGKKVRVKFQVQTRSAAGDRTVSVNTLLVGAPR